MYVYIWTHKILVFTQEFLVLCRIRPRVKSLFSDIFWSDICHWLKTWSATTKTQSESSVISLDLALRSSRVYFWHYCTALSNSTHSFIPFMPSSSHLKIFQIFSKSQSWLVQIYSHVYVSCIVYGECPYDYSQEEPSRSVWGRNYFLPASEPLSLRYVCSNTPPGHNPRTHTRKPPQGYRALRTRSKPAFGLQTRTNSEEGHAGPPGCRNTAPESGAAHGAPLKPPTAAAGRQPSLARPRQPPERSPSAAGQTPTPRSPGASPARRPFPRPPPRRRAPHLGPACCRRRSPSRRPWPRPGPAPGPMAAAAALPPRQAGGAGVAMATAGARRPARGLQGPRSTGLAWGGPRGGGRSPGMGCGPARPRRVGVRQRPSSG